MKRKVTWAILAVVLACSPVVLGGKAEDERNAQQDVVLSRLECEVAEVKALSHGNSLLLKALTEKMDILVDHDRETHGNLKSVESKVVGASVAISFLFTIVGGAVLKSMIKEK